MSRSCSLLGFDGHGIVQQTPGSSNRESLPMTEEKLNDVINGAMSRLLATRDSVQKEVESLVETLSARRREVAEIERKQTAARTDLAELIGKGEKALKRLEEIARQAAALKPALKEYKDLIGKKVHLVGGTHVAVVGAIDEDGVVTCFTEQRDVNGVYLGTYEFQVPRIALEKV